MEIRKHRKKAQAGETRQFTVKNCTKLISVKVSNPGAQFLICNVTREIMNIYRTFLFLD